MYYNLNNYPSAVTEERLAGIVCGAVKDYLSEQSEHVRHCHETIEEQQETIEEQQEIIEEQQETIDTLRQQVAELKQCLATCHAMSSKQVNFNKVGTVVAHADHVTLQYKAS